MSAPHEEMAGLVVAEEEYNLESFAADLAILEADPAVKALLYDDESNKDSLREYKKRVEGELHSVEVESVRDYVRQSSQVAGLHSEMLRCDAILARMQETLLGFQADLGSAAESIEDLQAQSTGYATKLRNRRAVESRLAAFLKRVTLSPDTARVLCDGPVNDAFVDRVQELDDRVRYVASEKKGAGKKKKNKRRTTTTEESEESEESRTTSRQLIASVDVAPSRILAVKSTTEVHAKLVLKACSRSREYILTKIAELPNLRTSVQIVQRDLSKRRYLVVFLERHAKASHAEIRRSYVNSMSMALESLFKVYTAELRKRELEVANKHDLIAVHESSLREYTFSSKIDLTKRGDGFSLGERAQALRDGMLAPPILVHVAEAEDLFYPFEALFRSTLKHVVDAAEAERDFLAVFFAVKGARLDELLNGIFAKTLSEILEHLENALFACHDVVMVLIIIRIVAEARLYIARRSRGALQILSTLFDNADRLLWPRLAAILAANLDSIRTADPTMLGTVGVSPHYVSRRYAELVSAARALFPEEQQRRRSSTSSTASSSQREELLKESIDLMRGEIVTLLDKLASAAKFDANQRTVFQINNYDRIISILRERLEADCEETKHFETLLLRYREVFVEVELANAGFTPLITFVKKNETRTPASPSIEEATVERLVLDFKGNWQRAIEAINADVLANFANFVNGTEVLKQVLTQLLLYYTRFHEIIRKTWRRPPPFAKDLVSTSAILVEIKKYSRTF